jgi:CO dehydrogenase maturation factor
MAKLAITGKGGVGKTTVASILARLYAAEGCNVLAIDADPDANLGAALGIQPDELNRITPIARMEELIHERMGGTPGTVGGFFKLNPKVDDIPDAFSLSKNGVKLLVLGTVKKGGSGCICPESALLRSLLTHMFLRRDDVVILDMKAGIEHLGRATAKGVDAFIVVVEPGMRSLETARAVKKLADDLGIKKCYIVGNKIQSEEDMTFIKENLKDFEVLGFLSQNNKIIEADRKGVSPFDVDSRVIAEVAEIKTRLESVSRLVAGE